MTNASVMPDTTTLATVTPTLDPLVRLLASDMERVNATIITRMGSDVPLIPQLAGHLIAAGGKRMRPLLTLAGAKLVEADAAGREPAVKLATAVEFIHSATLLHDDVIDESDLRRGRDTANALWGNDASVLVGDFLFARAFELMVEGGNIAVLGRLSQASAMITEGEIRQMAMTGEPATAMDEYLQVINGKTAVLFAAAAAAGAQIAGGSDAAITAMDRYGTALGMAFQIMDDALDYTADAAAMGKNAGDDFTDQKITMPVILAYQDGDTTERAFWDRTLGAGDHNAGDLATAQEILTTHDAINRSLAAAADYVADAIDALAPFRASSIAETATLAGAMASAAAYAAQRKS